ncbi:phosphatidylinositol 3-kinase [Jaminaea rosea]|uniref:Phosphatidylinositol 3-kinase VPS34 n=1 Tax=Jaminaea rosea TaxID=1569628 RepID=A0A316UW83_9BASI|nr:phosphatidylinositol 3-kinase [Jaminaea rosea]PWN29560.1 phosphatidylinositol 3-kinase [Jaminaea rosea]
MDPTRDFYSFIKLTDLPGNVTLNLRIASLQGNVERSRPLDLLEHPEKRQWGINVEEFPPFYLVVRLYSNNKPLTPPQRTPFKAFKKAWVWNQTVDLGFPLRDLPLDAQLGVTIWDAGRATSEGSSRDGACQDRIVGGTTLRLFGSKGTLKKAQQRCHVHLGVQADGSVNSSTDSKASTDDGSEMTRLEKLIKRHERLDIPHLKWLDKQTYRVIEGIHTKETETLTNRLWLYLDLPRFEWPVVWCEEEVATARSDHRGFGGPEISTHLASAVNSTTGPQAQPSTSTSGVSAQGSLVRPQAAAPLLDRSLFTLPDPESQRENPIEAKHRRLVRAQRSRRQAGGAGGGVAGGLANLTIARNLKPDKKARDEIEAILASPPTKELSDKESDLLWTYRFYLTKTPRGLTKFLKAVSWNDQVESRMAVDQVLPLWAGEAGTLGAVGIGDVLELLGPSCRMMHKAVRRWAVDRLAERDDEELGLYLLQLVQALKLDEREGEGDEAASTTTTTAAQSKKKDAVGARATSSSGASLGPLTDLLVSRSLASPTSLLFTFWWYLSVECSDDRWGSLYKRIRRRLERSLDANTLGIIRRQEKMVAKLGETARALRASKDARPKKIDKLRETLKDQGAVGLGAVGDEAGEMALLPLPLDPSVLARRVIPEKCSVFKSNLYPLLVHYQTEPNGEDSMEGPGDYALIFKSGDDLRQDQLVLQLFQLMDRLLLNENLDLKMTPYRVLATSAREGMVQFVPSRTLANIVGEYGSLAAYLKLDAAGNEATDVMDTFVRSCAGYCVVTYLLGVGDRHLDNLLLTPTGRFFHVDFGYILNRDPKPFPPPVKVSKEMVDCMGGTTSTHYARFRQLCFTAFSILRKNSGLILNLIGLMVDANVGDIKVEPDRAVAKVLEKFRLDLTESEAREYFDELLQQSSYLTVVFDRLHDAAQFFRS